VKNRKTLGILARVGHHLLRQKEIRGRRKRTRESNF